MIILFAFFAASVCTAFFFFNKAQRYKHILQSGAEQFERQKARIEHLENKATQMQKLQKSIRDQEKDLAKKVKEFEQKNGQTEKHFEIKLVEAGARHRSLELQRDHLLKQTDQNSDKIMQMQVELSQSVEQLSFANSENAKLRRESKNDQWITDREVWKAKVYTAETELEKRNYEIAKLHSLLQEAGPDKLDLIKRRAAHYERLFVSMRGLREMSEERSDNWELALKKLSQWVLAHHNRPTTSDKIGELAGEALEAIGGSLIDPKDDFAQPTQYA